MLGVVDENTKMACSLHAHLLLIYRNVPFEDLSTDIVSTVLSSFVFLTTRHTWNLCLLDFCETEIYELLQVTRRKLLRWTRLCKQTDLNQVMEAGM